MSLMDLTDYEPLYFRAREVIRELVEAMEIQEKRETGEFHLSAEAMGPIWFGAKKTARDFLEGKIE